MPYYDANPQGSFEISCNDILSKKICSLFIMFGEKCTIPPTGYCSKAAIAVSSAHENNNTIAINNVNNALIFIAIIITPLYL